MRSLTLLLLFIVVFAAPAYAQESQEPSVDGKALSEWIVQLESRDRAEQKKALLAIGKLGDKAEAALPVLLKALTSPLSGPGFGEAIAKIGVKAVPPLSKMFKGNGRFGPGKAATVLGLIGVSAPEKDADKIAALLLTEIVDGFSMKMMYATKAVESLGPKALNALTDALGDSKKSRRLKESYLGMIENMETKAARAIPVIVKRLSEEKNEALRGRIVKTLGIIGGNASKETCKELVPLFVSFVKGTELSTKYNAVRALGALGENVLVTDPEVGKVLIKILEKSDLGPKSFAAQSLRQIGKLADEDVKASVGALTNELRKDSQERRNNASKFIDDQIKSKLGATRKILEAAFGNDVYLQSILTLGSWGEHSASAVPLIVKALNEKGRFYRKAAAEALGQIGPDAKAALPELEKALKDSDKQVAEAAKKAIGKIKAAK